MDPPDQRQRNATAPRSIAAARGRPAAGQRRRDAAGAFADEKKILGSAPDAERMTTDIASVPGHAGPPVTSTGATHAVAAKPQRAIKPRWSLLFPGWWAQQGKNCRRDHRQEPLRQYDCAG